MTGYFFAKLQDVWRYFIDYCRGLYVRLRRHSAETMGLRSGLVNASILWIGMSITMPLGVITRIMVLRCLGSVRAGEFVFIDNFPMFLTSLLHLGLPTYIQKTIPPHPEVASEIFRPICLTLGGLGLIATLVIGGLIQAERGSMVTTVLCLILCLSQVIMALQDVLQRFYVAKNNILFVSALTVVSKVGLTIAVGAMLWTSAGLLGLGLAFLVPQLLSFVFFLSKARKDGLMGGSFHTQRIASIVRESLPFFVAGGINSSMASLHLSLLSKLSSDQEVGFFSTCFRLYTIFLFLSTTICTALSPQFARLYHGDQEKYARLLATVVRWLVLGTFPFCLGLVLFPSWITVGIYGADFAPAAPAMQITSFYLLLSSMTVFLSQSVLQIVTTGYRMALVMGAGAILKVSLLAAWPLLGQAGVGLGPGRPAAYAILTSTIAEVLILLGFTYSSSYGRALGGALRDMALLALLLLVGIQSDVWMQALSWGTRILAWGLFVPLYLTGVGILKWSEIRGLFQMAKRWLMVRRSPQY